MFSGDGRTFFFVRAIPQGGQGKFYHITVSSSQVTCPQGPIPRWHLGVCKATLEGVFLQRAEQRLMGEGHSPLLYTSHTHRGIAHTRTHEFINTWAHYPPCPPSLSSCVQVPDAHSSPDAHSVPAEPKGSRRKVSLRSGWVDRSH